MLFYFSEVFLLRLNASHVGALNVLELCQHASKYVCLLQTLLHETRRKAVKSLQGEYHLKKKKKKLVSD